MWKLYYLWLILLGTLVVNMVSCIFILAAGSSDGGKDLGSSIGFVQQYCPVACLICCALQLHFRHWRSFLRPMVPVRLRSACLCYVLSDCVVQRPVYNAYMKVCMQLYGMTLWTFS